MSVPIHPLSCWQRPMFLVNSRQGRFSATHPSFGGKPLHPSRLSLSRSYGDNWPSSLTAYHSNTLGFSPRLPVSVCGTVWIRAPVRGFSWQHDYGQLACPKARFPITSQDMTRRICLPGLPTGFDSHFQSAADLHFCVPPHGQTLLAQVQEY